MSWIDPPRSAVREAVTRALAEDLGVLGDLTAGLVPDDAVARAAFVCRGEGVLAGRLCAIETFAAVDPAVVVDWRIPDGVELRPGDVIAVVEGSLGSILTAERTALNLLGRLSGVATLTRRYVHAAQGLARIRDTRKTTPGLRALEKAAVRAGGGANHRGSLSDGLLVKDNHLAGLSITEAVQRAKRRWPGHPVEVECDTAAQVNEAVAAGADMVLLDNMTPDAVASCVKLVGGRAAVEVSGGVTLETVPHYAAAGVDFISVGALTHSAPAVDIGLDLQEA
ncbi:MAG TPA: carboxylating nicotinate-nucleotide diphosphorylase [Acidimicrobiales bacterium]|nr:carboxylating nicotinate-nucleotide diphosphorylase [Acidimicrobiales bacterium]